MKKFLRQSVITLLVTNIPLILLGTITWNASEYSWLFFAIPIATIGWLYVGVDHILGIEVTSGGGFIQTPNTTGWLTIVIGTIISLAVYYFIADIFFRVAKKCNQQD